MSKAISNVLIIGSGITGSSIANILNKNLKNKIKLSVFDKGYSPGGRMSRSFNKLNSKTIEIGFKHTLDQDKNFCPNKYDMSYHKLLNNKLIKSNLISENKVNYSPYNDYQDIIDFINRDTLIYSKCKVDSIHKDNKKWIVKSNNGKDLFDIIIFTIPINQIFEIDGDFVDNIENDHNYQKLKNVKYESNFALGLFYDKFKYINTSSKYLYNSNIIESIYIENKEKYSTIVVHAKDEWTQKNINLDNDKIVSLLKNEIYNYIPNLEADKYQSYILKKWKYSKVKNNTEVDSIDKAILVGKELPIIIAGDGICGNGYEKCVASAVNSYKLLNQLLK